MSACVKQHAVHLGNEVITIKEYAHGEGNMLVHLHQNEQTAFKAARWIINHKGGRLISLTHKGSRNVTFTLNHQHYEFDPNRIFTDKGIKKTLQKNSHYSLAAHREVKKLACEILKLIPPGTVIAVHNNRDYSMKHYLKGHALAKEKRDLSFQDKQHYRNFFLVTQRQAFLKLKRLHFNSILQKKHPVDDGSLSVYFAKRNYINVEAGYDALQKQIEMLQNVQ